MLLSKDIIDIFLTLALDNSISINETGLILQPRAGCNAVSIAKVTIPGNWNIRSFIEDSFPVIIIEIPSEEMFKSQ